jgi:hypothetical protein
MAAHSEHNIVEIKGLHDRRTGTAPGMFMGMERSIKDGALVWFMNGLSECPQANFHQRQESWGSGVFRPPLGSSRCLPSRGTPSCNAPLGRSLTLLLDPQSVATASSAPPWPPVL